MDDRDKRRTITPPAGVRAQTAAPMGADSWDGELTPLPQTTRLALEQVDRRVKSGGHATLDRVDDVSRRVEEVRDELRGDIGALGDKVSDLAERFASVDGKLEILVKDREIDRAVERQELSAVRVETVRADLEIHKSIRISEVQDDFSRRKHRRIVVRRVLSFLLKVVAGGGAVWAAISATIMARGC